MPTKICPLYSVFASVSLRGYTAGTDSSEPVGGIISFYIGLSLVCALCFKRIGGVLVWKQLQKANDEYTARQCPPNHTCDRQMKRTRASLILLASATSLLPIRSYYSSYSVLL
jgi:hypothetical protein